MSTKQKKEKRTVPLKEAIRILDEAYHNNPEESGKSVITIGGLYNALYKGKLKKYGPRHTRLVDIDEVLEVYGPQRAG